MANEFLQYFSLMQNQGMQQLNLAMGMQSLGLRRNQQALTERALALREQELPIAAEAERTKRADSLVGIFSTLSPLMSTEQQKSSMSILTDTLSQIGVLPKGGTIDFANLEETRLRVHQKIQDRDLEGAQQEFIKYRQQAHPGERQFGLEVLGADAAIQRERQQDPMAHLMEGRKRGIVIGERQAAQMKADDPVGFQQELDTRGLVVVPDGMLQSIDARTFELDGLSLMDPALVNEFFETKVMAARGMNVSDEKRQKAIVTERYLANNALQANLKANGLPVSEETEQTGIDLAIQLGLQEKRKAPPNEAERLANEERRTRIAKNNKSLAILDKELIHMDIDAQVKREMIPKIKAATDLLNNQALNVEGRTKIAEQDAQRVQAQYTAMLPDLTQRQQELTEANTQLVNELRVAANDPDSTPAETTLMQQEIHANNRMLQFVEQEIAFAQAVGPKMFVELQNLQSMIEHREEVRKAKTQEMNDLQRQTQDLRLAQTEGKEFENEQKRRAAAVADASALIANEAARRGVTGDKGMVKLIDEMKQAGTIPPDTLATPKSVKDFLTDQAAGGGKGNSIFESSSQAVKDVLLAKEGDLRQNATYTDVADAIDEVQNNKIEVALGRAQGLKDQENVRSAGEIFGIIDKFKALGEDLFTDNTFLRLSGIQGAGKVAQSYIQEDPRLKEYLRLREGLAGHLSRIGGERGMMTEGDIERAKNFVPDPTAFFPDSKETFKKIMRDFEDFVSNKVRGRYDQRALDALQMGSTSERKAASSVDDILAEAKKRAGAK